jgi:pyruvate kinase
MAALTTAQEYQAIREAIQKLTTLDSNGKRRDFVTVSVGDISTSYSASQLPELQKREIELANRRCNRNRRKRTSPDFSY